MTRDDIVKLAREAGFDVEPDEWHWLERFAALVAAHKTEVAIAEAYRCGHEAGVVEEREECAKICERDDSMRWAGAADAIRNRGNT